MKIDPILQDRLKMLINSMGYELIGCELASQNRQAIFRLYIDTPQGITVEDCTKVSQQVSAMLDVEEFMMSHYSLEVSSPGIDRPLFTLEQYQQQLGEHVAINLHLPVNARKRYKGVLVKIEGLDVYLFSDDLKVELQIPFTSIEKGHLIGKNAFTPGKKMKHERDKREKQ